MRHFLMVLILAVPAWGQRATDRPVRELLLEAGLTLRVVPANLREPGKVRVIEVIRGSGVKRDDTLDIRTILPAIREENSPDWGSLTELLLFGEPAEKPGEPFRLLPTGLRLVTKSGKSWVATSRSTGGFRLVEASSLDWTQLIAQMRNDAQELVLLESLAKQPPSSARNRELLVWMERHPPLRRAPSSPLAGQEPVNDLGDTSWGKLQSAPLHWILQTGIPEDSWKAVCVFARQQDGALTGRDFHPFATPEGRALLLNRAQDQTILQGDSLRALQMLTWAETYPTSKVEAAPFAKPLTGPEQQTLIQGVRVLLSRKENRWRQEAARALVALVRGYEKTPDSLRSVLVQEIEGIRKETGPGNTRNTLTEALVRLNAQRGPTALLLDLNRREAKLYFWLGVYPEGTRITEIPMLLIEEVAADGKTSEVEKKPLPCVEPPDWKSGWDTRQPLYVEVPFPKLKNGTRYQLMVVGSVGPQKTRFLSEPRQFKTEGTMQPWTPTHGTVVLDEQ